MGDEGEVPKFVDGLKVFVHKFLDNPCLKEIRP